MRFPFGPAAWPAAGFAAGGPTERTIFSGGEATHRSAFEASHPLAGGINFKMTGAVRGASDRAASQSATVRESRSCRGSEGWVWMSSTPLAGSPGRRET